MENQELGEIEKLGELGKIDNEISESETIQKPKRGRPKKEVVPKVKKPLTEKQLENLAKGREKSREALLKKYEGIREKKKEEFEKYAVKKANRIIEKKTKMKRDFGLDDEDSETEELIQVVKPIKPKKKKIITLPAESDSEEEVILKLPPKKVKSIEPAVVAIQPILKFY